MILPGYAPIYVFLCPLRKLGSLSPPNDIRKYFLFRAFDIDFDKLVFPVPGGPTYVSL
jgi:hypothetical protein